MILGIVNESTTAIRINKIQSTNIVYISSSTVPGHIVSVLDQLGYVSSRSSVTLSTTAGIRFSDGTSSIQITQPFGYVTLASQTPSNWSIINKSPFLDNASTILALDAKLISTPTTLIDGNLVAYNTSTSQLTTNYIFAAHGAVSKLGTQDAIFSAGGIYVSGNATLDSAITEDIRCLNMNITDISAQEMYVLGNVNMGGSFAASSMFMRGFVSEKLTVRFISTTNVSVSTATTNYISTGDTVTSTIGAGLVRVNDITLLQNTTTPLYAEWAELNTISTSSAFTSRLEFSRYSGSTLSSMILSSAAIQNPRGSLSIHTISSSAAAVSYINTLNAMATLANVSSIKLGNNWTISSIAPSARLTVGRLSTNTCTANEAHATNLNVGNLMTNTVSIDALKVRDTIQMGGNTFSAPHALIDNKYANAIFNTVATRNTTINTIYADVIGGPSFIMNELSTNSIKLSTISSAKVATKELTLANSITLGSAINTAVNEPTMTYAVQIPDSTYNAINSPPFQTGVGSGTYNDPFVATVTKNTRIIFSISNPTNGPLFLNIAYTHSNVEPGSPYGRSGGVIARINGEPFLSILNISQGSSSNRIYDHDISGAVANPDPITGGNNPWFYWDVQSATVTVDTIRLWVSSKKKAVDDIRPSIMDSNAGIEMNVASLVWPSTMYQTTIENSLNDIQTRSVLYTGSLKNTSDRSLKKDLEPADLKRLAAAVLNTPLRRYEYIPEYISTFAIRDKSRLGILTTELALNFPKSVHLETTPMSTIQVASIEQLKYAHLGATKFLMEEIKKLREEISALK